METLRKTTIVELNIISGQQLPSNKKKIQTYVSAWVNPNQKLTTRIDTVGNQNPTWNDKFVFAVSSELIKPYSTMVFDIYRVRRFRKNKRIGSVHVLVESLIGKSHSGGDEDARSGECMAFHVRGGSGGEPRGILNIGVSKLDGLFHGGFLGSSMAVDYRKLMMGGEEEESQPSSCFYGFRVTNLNFCTSFVTLLDNCNGCLIGNNKSISEYSKFHI